MAKKIHFITLLFFILILGCGFANIDLFMDSELKSKQYWLYCLIPLCSMGAIGLPGKIGKLNSLHWLVLTLLIYVFFRAISGLFMIPFLASCILFFLIFYLSANITERQNFSYFAASIVISVLLLAFYGIVQFAGIFTPDKHFEVVGNFDNPAGYASMLAFGTPFILYFTNSNKSRIRYWAWMAYATVCVAIFFSASRAGIVTILFLSLLFVINRHRQYIFKMTLWKKAALGALVFLVITGLYFAKKDSANGRLLIWRCTWEMIKDKPLLGHGYKSFEAQYMRYQAAYFEKNRESEKTLLADNIKHPFNEFMLCVAEFGWIAFTGILLFITSMIRVYLKDPRKETFSLLLSLIAISVFSCFSYPFSYPFTWLITGFDIGAFFALTTSLDKKASPHIVLKIMIVISALFLISYTVRNMYYDNKWSNLTNKKLSGDIYNAVSEYESLYPFLKNNPCFLYNFAVELNYIGEVEYSNLIATTCEKMLNDYDIQMLKANNYKKQNKLDKAIECYELASRMCPGRFIPLYELATIYDRINQPNKALKLAKEIIDKPVKVPSATISVIKMKMENRLGQYIKN